MTGHGLTGVLILGAIVAFGHTFGLLRCNGDSVPVSLILGLAVAVVWPVWAIAWLLVYAAEWITQP